jgi:hypothetical protein
VRRFSDIVQAGEQVPLKHLFRGGTVEALGLGVLVLTSSQ